MGQVCPAQQNASAYTTSDEDVSSLVAAWPIIPTKKKIKLKDYIFLF